MIVRGESISLMMSRKMLWCDSAVLDSMDAIHLIHLMVEYLKVKTDDHYASDEKVFLKMA